MIFLYLALLLLFGLAFCYAEETQEKAKSTSRMQHTLPAQTVSVSRATWRKSYDKKKNPFEHTRRFFDALLTGAKTFELLEKTDHTSASAWKIESFDDTMDKAYTLVLSKYTLREQDEYVHLNNAVKAGGHVESKSDRHLTHCASDSSANSMSTVKANSILIGHIVDNQDSLEFSHHVVSVTHLVERDRHCTTLQLEQLHPMELFANINVQALIERPFHNTMEPEAEDDETVAEDSHYHVLQEDPDPEQGVRKLEVLTPSSPLIQCSNPIYQKGLQGLGAATILGQTSKSLPKGGTARAALGTARGCASLAYDVPGSISFNYGGNVKAASSIDIQNGLLKAIKGARRWELINYAMKKAGTTKAGKFLKEFSTDFQGIVSCDNCFLVAGAGAIVVVNYDTGCKLCVELNLRAQIKTGGEAGAAIVLTGKAGNFNIQAPPLTFGKNKELFGVPIPLGGGVGVTVKFILTKAEINFKGTGQTAGSFVWGEGAHAQAYVGVNYDFKSKGGGAGLVPWKKFSAINLYARGDKKFRILKKWKAAATVTARINVELIFGGLAPVSTDTLKATFFVALAVTGQLESPKGTAGVLSDLNLAAAADRRQLLSRKQATDKVSALTAYKPGDMIQWSHRYSEFNPNEVAHVYTYLVNAATGAEFPIKDQILHTRSGSGTITGEWMVPWDLRLADLSDWIMTDMAKDPSAQSQSQSQSQGPNQGIYLKVRTDIWGDSATVQSTPFRFDLFSAADTDGIFDQPAAGAQLQSYSPISASWDATLLHRFQSDMLTTYKGQDVSTSKVDIELVMENLSADQTVASSRSETLAYRIDNTGYAVLHFNATLASAFDRFYLLVSDSSDRNVQGWSKGYFTVDARSNNLRSAQESPRSLKITSHKDLQSHLFGSEKDDINMGIDARLLEAMDTLALFPPAPAPARTNPHSSEKEKEEAEDGVADEADASAFAIVPEEEEEESRALAVPRPRGRVQHAAPLPAAPRPGAGATRPCAIKLPMSVTLSVNFGVTSFGFYFGEWSKTYKPVKGATKAMVIYQVAGAVSYC